MRAVSAEDGDLTVAEKGRWGVVLALPLITILPVLLFTIATVAYLTQQQQDTLEREILQIARQSSQAADFLLNDRLSTLDALSSLAVEGDWQGFSYQSRHLVESRVDWARIAVQRPDNTIVSTEAAPGAPNLSQLDLAPLGPDGMQPAILVQASGAAPVLLVRKTINHPEQGQLTVAAILSLEPFSQVLAGRTDPNWTVAVLDPNRLIAGRSRESYG